MMSMKTRQGIAQGVSCLPSILTSTGMQKSQEHSHLAFLWTWSLCTMHVLRWGKAESTCPEFLLLESVCWYITCISRLKWSSVLPISPVSLSYKVLHLGLCMSILRVTQEIIMCLYWLWISIAWGRVLSVIGGTKYGIWIYSHCCMVCSCIWSVWVVLLYR